MRKNHPKINKREAPEQVTKFSPRMNVPIPGQGGMSQLHGVTAEKKGPLDEMGVMGAKVSHGYVYEEFLPVLQGDRGRRTLREMSDNDPTVGAILFAIEMILRAVTWEVKTKDKIDSEGFQVEDYSQHYTNRTITDEETAIEFVKGVLFEDMEHTWDDFIGQVLTMLVYGWQYSEIVWKRRVGPFSKNLKFKSNFSDGMIGIRKLADRSQETIERWTMDDHGNIYGMVQGHPFGGGQYYIPMDRALLFRPKLWKGSPEGKSVIRSAYRPWFFLKNLQEIEAIAHERELNGFPVIYAPNRIINGTTAEAKAAARGYERMVRDIKFNEQGGAVLPSDPWFDDEGSPTSLRQVELTLLSSGGSRSIDIDKSITRYQTDIARTVLADFIMLGTSGKGGGARALGENKSELFLLALKGWNESIAEVINRDLITKLWQKNNIDPELMPRVVPGNISPEDLGVLGKYVNDLSASGFVLFDEPTEDYLRAAGGLPDRPEGTDAIQRPLPEEEKKAPTEMPTEGEEK